MPTNDDPSYLSKPGNIIIKQFRANKPVIFVVTFASNLMRGAVLTAALLLALLVM